MGYYKILSSPLPYAKERYKGLHRAEPGYGSGTNRKYLSYWHRDVDCKEPSKHMGINAEFSIEELKEYAKLASEENGEGYEVIYFSEYKTCPHECEYYGVDVAGFGGYSMVGEEFFTRGSSQVYDILIDYFMERINQNGLFNTYEDGEKFRKVITELGTWRPGCIEDEEWKVLHVFKIL